MRKCAFVMLICSLFAGSGCKSVYYDTMEALGKPKRQLLIGSVQDARDSQILAKEQFVNALDKFKEVTNYSGGLLEDKYDQLKAEYDASETKSKAVKKYIADVKSVAKALFKEWQAELDEYTSEQLRRVSRAKLEDTQLNYDRLIMKMDRASASMNPVLGALNDQVLFLKHELNAQAIVSLKEELVWVEKNTDKLVREMEASIAEAEAFVNAMHRE